MTDKDELGETMQRSVSTPGTPTPGEGLSTLPVEAPGRYGVPEGATDILLGAGGMGRVLRLEDTHLQREVAVKELLAKHGPGVSEHGDALGLQFVREARILARLEHPGVVPIYELGRRENGTLYYSMRRIRGQTLKDVLTGCATLDDRLALLPHLVDVVQTVAYAHDRKVIHRDLKPANIMVGRFGETQVLDWGLAVVVGEQEPDGVTAGTPAYMSPEQAAGKVVDYRSDVWSLGVMLFELLTGRRPFEGGTASDVVNQLLARDVPRVAAFEPAAPKGLVAVVERALWRDPAARYADGAELAAALEALGRARSPRPLAWMAAALGATAVALLAVAWAGLSAGQDQTALAAARRTALEAGRGRALALADEAVLALRAQDLVMAERLATESLALGQVPLAVGVRVLTRERGLPVRAWSVATEAGCSQLAQAGDAVACATLNGVELFAAADGAARGKLSAGPLGWQHAVTALSADRLASAGDDRTLHVWSVSTAKQVEAVSGFEAGLVALAAEGDAFLVGLRDGRVQRVKDGAREDVWRGAGPVRALAAGGGVLATAWPGVVRFRKADGTSAELERSAVAVLPAKDRLLMGVERSVVSVDGQSGVAVWTGHRDEVTALALLGGRVVSGSADGVLRWWYPDGTLGGQLDGFAPGVQAVLALPGEAPRVAVANRRRALEVWSLPEPVPPLPEDGLPTVHAWTEPGWLLSGLRDGRIRRVDLATREVTTVEAKHEGPVRGLAVVPGPGRPERVRFLSGGEDGEVKAQRWNGSVETLDAVAGGRVFGLDVSADASRAAWSFADGTRVVFGLELGKEISRERDGLVRVLAFSPNGRQLAAGREDKRVSLVDPDSGKELARLEPLNGAVTALAWSPDGTLLATGDASGAVVLWSVAERRVVRQLGEARERIGALAFSAKGAAVAAGGDDGQVVVFEVGSGALIAKIPSDAGELMSLRFTADDALFAIGADRLPHVWPLETMR